MPEGVGYGPQNTASVGKDIHVIGNHCYAFSGVIASAGSESAATTSTLLFTSGNYYAKVKLSFSNDNIQTTANSYYLIKFNDQIVYKAEQENNMDTVTNPIVIHMIIPPFTKVETLVGTNADAHDFTTLISGRIYGKVD